MKSITIKSLVAAALMLPFAAGAVPIEGNIGITGALLPTCGGDSNNCSMDLADGLTFSTPGIVVFATQDFDSTIDFGDLVSMTDFTFSPFGGVDPLWSVGGFSFALESLTIMGQTSTQLLMTGAGTISAAGFDDTMGIWSFSADTADRSISFAWSSTTLANPTPAPEPGILFLMGLGLIGGLGARRLRR